MIEWLQGVLKAQPRNIIVLITRNRLLDWTIPVWKISVWWGRRLLTRRSCFKPYWRTCR